MYYSCKFTEVDKTKIIDGNKNHRKKNKTINGKRKN